MHRSPDRAAARPAEAAGAAAPEPPARPAGLPAPLLDRSALALRDALAAGELSAREVADAALGAAQERAGLGAFVTLDADAARARAARLDEQHAAARRSGVPLASLHGLPTAFKDLVDVLGLPTRRGSALLADAPPAVRDEAAAARLRQAGTVVLGKTTVPEFGLDSYSENRVTAPARTPLDPTRTAGGSTGGSAAAVAAGILPFAPGSDGGGSIRIPAAACGLVGLKPGRGAVPGDGAEDTVRSLTVTGPLARTAADAALLFDVLTTPEGLPGRALADVVRLRERAAAGDAPAPLVVGVTAATPFTPDVDVVLDRAALDALARAAAALASGGHEVVELDPAYGPGYHRDFRMVWTAGLLDAPLPAGAEALLGDVAASSLASARATGAEEIAAATERLGAWARRTRATFGGVDVVLTPVLAVAPPHVGHFLALPPEENYAAQCAFTPYTSMVNVMGLPAVSVPVLADDAGLSWSVQLVGRPGTEAGLLALAAHLELLLGR